MSDTHQAKRPGTPALVTAVTLGVVFCLWVATALTQLPKLPGRLLADDATGYISVLSDFVARLSGSATIGLLVASVFFTRQPAVAATTRRWGGRAAQVWFWSAFLLTFAQAAYVNGARIGVTMTPASWWAFQTATPTSLAWVFAAIIAGATAVACYRRVSRPGMAALAGLGIAAFTGVAATGNISVGADHDWATDAATVQAVAASVLVAAAIGAWLGGDQRHPLTDGVLRERRYARLALPLVAALVAGQAVVGWQQMAGATWWSFPGMPMLGTFVVAAVLATLALVRLTGRRVPLLLDILAIVALLAFQTAQNHIPTPRFLLPQSIQINYLGYEMTVPDTIARLVSPGRPNLLWVVLALVAVIPYVVAFIRIRRTGGRWPAWRLLVWLLGWGSIWFLATSGMWEYSTAQFSWHMVVHMTVNMLTPVLCVLGSPLSLWRAAVRERPMLPSVIGVADSLVDYRPWQRVFSPPVLWVNYVGSLFLVYYTPLFGWLMRYHWAHQLMLAYFMVTGYTFFSLIVGTDRQSWRLPHIVKLALVISIMPFHAIFAVGIMSSRTLFGGDFYRSIAASWVPDLLGDQHVAGQASWLLGEIPLFIVIIALSAQWFYADRSESKTIDAGFDAGTDGEYDAYNDMLAELASRDEARR